MILFDSPIIRLDYTPATDILIADLSNRHEFYSLEIRETLQIIVEHVRHYDVRCLLMDSRKRVLVIDDLEYADLMTNFRKALQATNLRKLARLNTGIAGRETLARSFDTQTDSSYVMRTFTNFEQAIEWLKLNG